MKVLALVLVSCPELVRANTRQSEAASTKAKLNVFVVIGWTDGIIEIIARRQTSTRRFCLASRLWLALEPSKLRLSPSS